MNRAVGWRICIMAAGRGIVRNQGEITIRQPQVYRMLKYGQQYVDKGAEYYEERNRQQQIEFVRKKAAQLGLQVTPGQPDGGQSVPSRERRFRLNLRLAATLALLPKVA